MQVEPSKFENIPKTSQPLEVEPRSNIPFKSFIKNDNQYQLKGLENYLEKIFSTNSKEIGTQTAIKCSPSSRRKYIQSFEARKGTKQYYIDMEMGDRKVSMLLDGGSSMTIIGLNTFNAIKGKLGLV